VRQQPQRLFDVRLRAAEELRAQLLILAGGELGDRRVEVVGHPARERRRLRQKLARELLHR
jgi:hypothetical protein